MSYIEWAKRELLGLTDHEIWKRIGHFESNHHLLHPSQLAVDDLRRIIPTHLDVEEVMKRIATKQKEIAQRVDIKHLPTDRPPGFIGQIALFEVLRDYNIDFSCYFDKILDSMGFIFFRYLANVQYFISFLGYSSSMDITQPYLKRVEETGFTARYEELWYDRISRTTRTILHNLNIFRSHLYKTIIEKLVAIENHNEFNFTNVMRWTGCNKREVKLLFSALFLGGGAMPSYIADLNRLGINRIMKRGFSSRYGSIELVMSCRHAITRESATFSSHLVSGSDYSEPTLNIEGEKWNLNLFNPQAKTWILPDSYTHFNSIQHLSCSFDKVTSFEASTRTSQRDMYVVGALRTLTRNIPPEKLLTQKFNIDTGEARNALRMVLRKQLVHPTYRISIGPSVPVLTIVSGERNGAIRSIGCIVHLTPFSFARFSRTGSDAYIVSSVPVSLSQRFFQEIHELNVEHDVIDGPYILESFKTYHFSSILNLIQ